MHWLLLGSTIVLILTGLSQYATAPPEWSIFGGTLPAYFWPGRVHLIHAYASLVFVPAVLAATWIYLWQRERYRLTHFLLLIGGLALVVSGLAMSEPPVSPNLYRTARWVHAIFGLGVVPAAFLVHLLEGLTRYRRALIASFNPFSTPRVGPVAAFLVLAALTTSGLLGGLPGHFPWRDLTVGRIAVPRRGLDLAELPWEEAPSLVFGLASGAGFPGGHTEVSLKALHDGQDIYVLAQWRDATEDRQYWPWKKTADGWQLLMTKEKDETVYYEDKFSLVFPVRPDWQFERFGCAASCHVDSGYAYGYKGCPGVIDSWHWKATRTDPVGQVDDKYWSTIDFTLTDVGRYGDPSEGGGYKKNLADDRSHPPFLPAVPGDVRQGMIPAKFAVPYTPKAADRIAPDTLVPGILASKFLGDRGDVTCQSVYEGGQWRVIMRRKLDTGSPYDVKFTPGQVYCFGCAAFNRAAKRHAYNMSTYRLVLQP